MGMLRFPTRTPKAGKETRGKTPVATTPIDIRTKLSLTERFEDHVRTRLAARIGHAATVIERGTVRFEDVNGPKGGVDTVCKIRLVVSQAPAVQVSARGQRPDDAFKAALDPLARALEKMRATHKLFTHRGRNRPRRERPTPLASATPRAPRAKPKTILANDSRATAALELEPAVRPSRKSTRKSSNRGKPSQKLERTAQAQAVTPRAKNRRGAPATR